MIGSLSNYAEALVLNSVFGRSASYEWPATLYFALFNTVPDDAGANGQEVAASGTGYARKAVTNSTANFADTATSTNPSATPLPTVKGVKKNLTAIVFPTALGDWGEVRGGGIYDAATGGNPLWLWEWSQVRSVTVNDTMRVEAGELQFTFNAEDLVNGDCVLSFALQRAFLDAFFGRPGAPAIPGELYAALMTVVPGQLPGAGTLTDTDELVNAGAELAAAGYSRVQIPNDPARFPNYLNGRKSNGQQILWPTAGAAWSSVKGVAFYSTSSGGTLIAKLKLETTQNWVEGDSPRIAATQLPIFGD